MEKFEISASCCKCCARRLCAAVSGSAGAVGVLAQPANMDSMANKISMREAGLAAAASNFGVVKVFTKSCLSSGFEFVRSADQNLIIRMNA